jgi:hypothetical protein
MWEIYSRKPLFEGETNFELLTPSIIKGNRPISVDKLTKLIKDEKDDNIKSYLKLIKHGKEFKLTLAWAHDPEDRPKLDFCIITLRELIMKKSTQITNENNQQINKYEVVSSLGQGGQAQVFLVKEKSSSNLYALKKFQPKKLLALNETLQEVQPNIFNTTQ